MKVCAISDLHGNLIDIESCELLLISGDISPLNIQFNVSKMELWFIEFFLEWCENQPCEEIVFIAGNHDCYLNSRPLEYIRGLIRKYCDKTVTYLENETYDYLSNEGKVYRIFGTPFCHIFGDWPFMLTDETLDRKFQEIPENCDIVISHDCPYGTGDQCLQLNDEHRGSKPLRDVILRAQPTYLLTGHLHSANHLEELLGNTKVINTSIVDECYNVVYKPLYLDV